MAHNNNGNLVEMTLAMVDKLGRDNTEWLAEWYPELFEYPCEAWKVEEFFYLFETEEEALECMGYDTLDDMQEDYMVLMDAGIDGIIVIE